MNEIFEFITLMIASHILIGFSIVLGVGLLLRFLSLNAATRHNIWLGLLVLLLLMPLVTYLSSEVIDDPLTIQSLGQTPTSGSAINYLAPSVELSQPPQQINREPGITVAVTSFASVLDAVTKLPFLTQLGDAVTDAIPLKWLGIAFTLIIALGIVLKLLMFIRSYRNLRALYNTSETVSDEWLATVARFAAQIGVRNCRAVKHSAAVNTPSTSGVLHPWIILPTSLIETNQSPQFMEQVLLHELAHIKRRDPFIASLQALVSIFMFWHPAIHYVNKQIRFERELACDDWVIKHTEEGNTAKIKTYADSLLGIAESLQKKVSITHSVACVHTSHGLASRINILLDRSADHSTPVNRTLCALVTLAALVLLITSSPLWPQMPRANAEEPRRESDPSYLAPILVTEFAEGSGLIAEVSGVVVETQDQGLQQAAIVVENDAPQLEKSSPSVVDLATSSVTPGTINPLVDLELENSVNERIASLPIKELMTLDLVTQLSSSEKMTKSITNYLQYTVELTQDFSSIISSHPQNSVLTEEHSRTAETMNAVIQKDDSRDSFIVIEDLSRPELREEIRKIEQEYFRVFNANIEETDLKIECGTYLPTGSFIKRHYCEPRFVISARSEDVRNAFDRSDSLAIQWGDLRNPRNIIFDLKTEFGLLTEAMNSVLQESEYFRDLNRTLRMLKERLQEIA